MKLTAITYSESSRFKQLLSEDQQLATANKRLREANENAWSAEAKVQAALVVSGGERSSRVDQALKAQQKAEDIYDNAVEKSSALAKRMGTGKVGILLPHNHFDSTAP